MRKRTAVLVALASAAVLIVVAVLVGGRLYGNWVNSNADEAPSLRTPSEAPSASSSGAPAARTLSGEWTVGEGSFAGYRVQEVLNGQDVTVTGRTEDVTGAVSLVDGRLREGRIEVDLTTIATDEERRDEYFRSDALETDRFPTATFELTEPVDATTDGSDLELEGELTIHGVTRPATATTQVGRDGEGLQVVGSVPIRFADFDVEAPDLGFVVVEDQGAIEFSLELGRA